MYNQIFWKSSNIDKYVLSNFYWFNNLCQIIAYGYSLYGVLTQQRGKLGGWYRYYILNFWLVAETFRFNIEANIYSSVQHMSKFKIIWAAYKLTKRHVWLRYLIVSQVF